MTRLRSIGACLAIVAVLTLAGVQAASARTTGAQVRAQLNQIVSSLTAMGVPGGVIGVTGGPVGRYSAAFGIAAPGTPMTLNTHFRIGSVSKTFTATVILKLVDLGRLRLDQSIAKWEPKIPNAKRITIRMLLNMTSGIWDEGGNGPTGRESLLSKWIDRHCPLKDPLPDCSKFWRPQQLVDLAIQEGPAAYPPGIFYYSDTNYMILGIIAQKVMHQNLGSLVQRFILKPLHMRQTSMPTLTLTIPAPAANGYMTLPAAPKTPTHYVPGAIPSPSTLFAAGNVVSTLGDLEIWARALATGALLKPATQRIRIGTLVSTGGAFIPLPGTFRSILPLSYGLGIGRLGNLFGHNGAIPPFGFTAETWYLPSARGSVVVLLNSVTPCASGLLSDVVAGTIPFIAYGQAASGAASDPGLLGDGCPTLTGPTPAG
jgi:D-alanyl-D-alanine carboxypeptidase